MGWWSSLWSSSANPEDPLRKLDPKLREFLEKESPIKYPAQPAAKPDPPATQPSTGKAAAQDDPSKPRVPKESIFQDGRYADLWKTYRPLAEIEAETKSDQEKIMDVLEGYKQRKEHIGKAALENCALEQVDWRECMMNPSFSERMTLCRTQVKKFERCYLMQTRLLKTLGYLSTYDRPPEVEEQIQMHADKIYHQLMAQEAEIDKAKAEGRPIPTFPSILPKKPMVVAANSQRELTAQEQETLKAKLAKVNPEDRAAEEESIKAEMRAKDEIAQRLKGIRDEADAERQKRKEKGEATMLDKMVTAFRLGGGGDSKK